MFHSRRREKLANWFLKMAEYVGIALVINAFLPQSHLGKLHILSGITVTFLLVIIALSITPAEERNG